VHKYPNNKSVGQHPNIITIEPVAKLEVVLVVLGTTKHFSKEIIFYCLKKNSPKILKMIHGTLASSIKCEILSNPVILL
jgi:hypothetical protein